MVPTFELAHATASACVCPFVAAFALVEIPIGIAVITNITTITKANKCLILLFILCFSFF